MTWDVGDEIIIASTGDRHSQIENEKVKILQKSSDNRVLTLESKLEYTHLGEQTTQGGFIVEFRAEVGKLSHNVVVRGESDPVWEDIISACPEGFDTGIHFFYYSRLLT